MAFKFVHCADIHLDSPLRGLERYESAPIETIRNATRRASDNLIQLALDEEVDFVVISGDLYDQEWKDYNTGLFFVNQMAKLRRKNIPVVIVLGNHDAASKMTRALRLPENVTVLSHKEPQTHRLDGLSVAFHGQSFATGAVKEDLSRAYPDAISGCFNIGLLHTCARGHPDHDSYAPCTIEGLVAKQYDYWALGHVHTREILHQSPPIVFPGNLQGRHIRETGAKGCMLVAVDGRGKCELQFRALDVLRWAHLVVDGTGCPTPMEVVDRFSAQLAELERQGRPVAVRVEVQGATSAHSGLMADTHRWVNEVRSRATDQFGEGVWVEKVVLKTEPVGEGGRVADGPTAELMALFTELETDDARLGTLSHELDDLLKKLPAELKRELRFDAGWVREALSEVRPFLMQRLRDGKR